MKKTIVISGASDGIGAAAAQTLHAAGHEVVVVGRSPDKTRLVAEPLGCAYFIADFSRLEEVRRIAGELEAAYPRIDVLANNAGGIFRDERTVDGFETTFQVNHLAPFLLTNLLIDTLVRSRTSVIQTSSAAARLFGNLDLSDLQNEGSFSPNKAYGDAKLANILFTRELHARFHDQGLSAAAFHPGPIATNFASDTSSAMRFVYGTPLRRLLLRGVDKGAEQLVWLAGGAPGTDWQSGQYYERHRVAGRVHLQVGDAGLAAELWDRSAALVGLAPLRRPSSGS